MHDANDIFNFILVPLFSSIPGFFSIRSMFYIMENYQTLY